MSGSLIITRTQFYKFQLHVVLLDMDLLKLVLFIT